MAHTSNIEWTEATWNPWHGCHKVSQGCKNCYMFREKERFGQDPNVVVRSKTKFYDPLKWSEPRTIFTCSWSDFFIEEADAWRDEAFAIMALTPQHTYQVLTKRPERMLEYFNDIERTAIIDHIWAISKDRKIQDEVSGNVMMSFLNKTGLPNVWLGVSVEDQKTAHERIPMLLDTPAAVRWLSIEPLLGPVNLTQFPVCEGVWANYLTGRDSIDDGREVVHQGVPVQYNSIDWIVAGGESGPDARPMHPHWVRSIRDQCTAAGVPFFFKQWGEYGYVKAENPTWPDGSPVPENCSPVRCLRIGKKAAGRTLDGRTWNQYPEVLR